MLAEAFDMNDDTQLLTVHDPHLHTKQTGRTKQKLSTLALRLYSNVNAILSPKTWQSTSPVQIGPK